MQAVIGLLFGLCGAFLLLSAKQVSRDTVRAAKTRHGSLTGPLPAGAVRIGGVLCLVLAAVWLLH